VKFFSTREERLKKIANAYIVRQQLRGINRTCKWLPCHKKGLQDCSFCVCPFFPCQDTELGKWYHWEKDGKTGKVWDCSGCALNHKRNIAMYLLDHIKNVKDHATNMLLLPIVKKMYLLD